MKSIFKVCLALAVVGMLCLGTVGCSNPLSTTSTGSGCACDK